MRGGPSVFGALGVAGLLVVLGLAVAERWQEPASSPAIGAEDPYTHMVFVREHVANGGFAERSDRIGVGLYPPGMHALVGILWQDSGIDLYQLARWFPLAFGVVAAWGTYALLARHGPARADARGTNWAALVGAGLAGFVVATNPEHVVRTDLLFPTGLDLALLPWVFLGIADALTGDRRGLVVAGVLGAALVVAHPWIGFVIAGAGVLAAGLGLLLSTEEEERGAVDAMLTGVVLAGIALFAAVYQGRFDGDKGFGTAGYVAAGLSLAAAAVFLLFRAPFLAPVRGRPATRVVAAGIVAATVAGAFFAVINAEELPLHVNYTRMLGTPLLVFLALGAVAVALRPSPAGLLGLAACAVTFPFTAFDLLDSWYLPHRTMVYLVAGAAIVAGHGAGLLVETLASHRAVATRRAAPVAVAAVVLLAGIGSVAGGTPDAYVWDRYLTDDEFRAVERLAERLDAAGSRDHVITTSWIVNVHLGALSDADLSHFRDGFFKTEEKRAEVLEDFSENGWEPIVVVDGYTLEMAERKGLDLSFLESWTVLDRAGDLTVYGRS